MIIETIKVKPTGFLASWRYVNVEITDNGIISNSDVADKPTVNLEKISDYRSNNRAYANGALITTFCNFITFTRFNMYAMDDRPFAYVETNLNDTTCGYLTPLPEPAVPENPFGTPIYGPYKTFDYCNDNGENVNVTISKKKYTGSVSVIKTGDGTPVKLSYKPVDNKSDVIRPLECVLSFINDGLLLSEFYTEDERTFLVEVKVVSLTVFKGYVIPDSCSEPFANANYPVSIKCTDGIGSLKSVTYPTPSGPTFDLKQSFIDILAYCLAPLNTNLPISTICNLYEVSMPNGLNDDPLSLSAINPLRLTDDKGKTLTCYEALKSVCEAWGMWVSQVNGKWMFVRYNEPSKLVVRQRNYNFKALFLSAENIENDRSVANSNSVDYIALSGGEKQIEGGYKRVSVLSSFGKVPSILYNGDFEAWNGFNFTFWTRYGGIDISRIQRTVTNTQGADIPIQNYALQFNQRANPGKWIEQDRSKVNQGDKIRVSYRVSNIPYDPLLIAVGVGYKFKLRIKVGEYYLFNRDGSNTYEWTKSLSYVINEISNISGNLNTFTFGFDIPETPVTGNMIIQLYGFDTTYDYIEPYVPGINPISVDDITFTKTSQSGDNDVLGILNFTDNLRYYTNNPDRIEILFGDLFFRKLATQELDNLYAIYIGDKNSTAWVEYGVSGAPVAFGMALAKSIMRAYQIASVNWNGELKLSKDASPFNYLDVLKFNTPSEPTFSDKTFTFLGVDIDLKTNRLYNVKMAEVFDVAMVSVDNTVPYYPNSPDPIFIQDANYIKVLGIFTSEFTQEFN